jgi:hypothetical protein
MCRRCSAREWRLNNRRAAKRFSEEFNKKLGVSNVLTPQQRVALCGIERVPRLKSPQGVGELSAAIEAQQQFDRVEFAHPPMPTADEQSEIFEWAELPAEEGLPG